MPGAGTLTIEIEVPAVATFAQVRDACDSKLTAITAAIVAQQTAYAAAHKGRYWQGLTTHTTPPRDGAEAAPDVGATVPTDQPTPWPDALRTVAMPMAIQIDVYDGPLGCGYTTTLTAEVGGVRYSRCANVGPETGRARGWAAVVEGGV